jgi:hypothetical protein
MARDLKLFVVDTGPLITLAVARSLDYLLYVDARPAGPQLREPDLGERAAVEVIEEPDRLEGTERVLLLCEETAVLKRAIVRDRNRIVEISTLAFLRILEAEQRIQSAAPVFELAAAASRHASRVEKLSTQDEATRAAIQGLARRRDPS